MDNILEKINELKAQGEVLNASYDPVFKSIMQDDDLRDYIAFIISNIDKKIIDKDKMIFVSTESTKKTIADKINVHDIMIDIDNNRISLEMNRKINKELRKKNVSHFFEGGLKAINISYRTGKENYYEQINFDYTNIEEDLISVYRRVNMKTKEVDSDEKNIIKYRINLAKVYKKYYTDNEELTRFEKALLMLTISKRKDLREISRGDEMLMRVEKKIEELCEDPDLVRYIDDEKAMEFGHKLDIEEAVGKAIEKMRKEVT